MFKTHCPICGKDLEWIADTLNIDFMEVVAFHRVVHLFKTSEKVLKIFDEVVEKYDNEDVVELRKILDVDNWR